METKRGMSEGQEVQEFLEVQVMPDLIDFDKVKHAEISLRYADPVNGIDAKRDVILVANAKDPVKWTVELKDRAKVAYQWQATFFMADGSTSQTPVMSSEEPTVIPQLAQAQAPGA